MIILPNGARLRLQAVDAYHIKGTGNNKHITIYLRGGVSLKFYEHYETICKQLDTAFGILDNVDAEPSLQVTPIKIIEYRIAYLQQLVDKRNKVVSSPDYEQPLLKAEIEGLEYALECFQMGIDELDTE